MQPSRWINPLTDEEANVLRDGQRMRVPLMMRDHATPNLPLADEQRAQQRGISHSQAQYENRLSDAWKQDVPTQPQVVAKLGDNGQAAYESRVLNAWKGGA